MVNLAEEHSVEAQTCIRMSVDVLFWSPTVWSVLHFLHSQ